MFFRGMVDVFSRYGGGFLGVAFALCYSQRLINANLSRARNTIKNYHFPALNMLSNVHIYARMVGKCKGLRARIC